MCHLLGLLLRQGLEHSLDGLEQFVHDGADRAAGTIEALGRPRQEIDALRTDADAIAAAAIR